MKSSVADPVEDVARRLERFDWEAIARSLDESGYAKTPALLTPEECRALIELYTDDTKFRSRVDMARHRFGLGEYKYFGDPLPPIVQAVRVAAYPPLASVANRWAEALGIRERFATRLDDFLQVCRRSGQSRPTPLLLRYEAGGYNCLHQDLYGEVAFPLQLTCVLSRLGRDYTGGEFLLIEQRPRAQSRGAAVSLEQGEAVIFASRERPVRGTRGHYRTNMRHGVSPLRSGRRYSLGIIFHNAK